MFCTKCGSTLNENGVCPVCSAPVSDPIDPDLIFDTPPAASNPGKGLGIAGMITGIASLLCNTVCACIPLVNYVTGALGLPLTIVGLILSIIAKKKSKAAGFPNGMATAGLITSIVSIVIYALAVIVIILYFVLVLGASFLGAAGSTPTYG